MPHNVTLFNWIALILFALAIVHSFLTHAIRQYALRVQAIYSPRRTIKAELLFFMSEFEVVFGLWAIPQLLAMSYFFTWNGMLHYLQGIEFTEPFFVAVVMVVAASQPIVQLVERIFLKITGDQEKQLTAWWLTVMAIGPLLSVIMKETSAMMLSVALLVEHFYRYRPSIKLATLTLAILCVNISVSSILTPVASSAVVIVANAWGWDLEFIGLHFAWKALLIIFINTIIGYALYREEFFYLDRRAAIARYLRRQTQDIPIWIGCFTLLVLAWIIIHEYHPVIFIGTFILFLGFYRVLFLQGRYQLQTSQALMVGFFLATVVLHSQLQTWWITPLLTNTRETLLLPLSMLLSAISQNAIFSYLVSHIETLGVVAKYAIVAGVVSGGGLTLIANSPNFAAFSMINPHMQMGISPWNLFMSAIWPTIVSFLIFAIL